jgi:excisionase family DNA binding protein
MKFISVRHAADALGFTAQTIRRLIWQKDIAGVRVGQRGWRIPESELERFAARAQNGHDVNKEGN